MNEINEQINAMSSMLKEGSFEEKETVENETEQEELNEEEETTTKEETKEEIEEEEETTPESAELITLKAENEEFKNRLRKLESAKETKQETEQEEEPETIEEQDFIGDIEVETLVNDPKAFNSVLNKVLMKGIELGEGRSKKHNEHVLRSIPEIVKANLNTVQSLKKMSEDFYTENEDLKPFKKVVAVVFEETMSENTDKGYAEVLKLTGDEVRKRLNLHKKATTVNRETNPRLPNKGRQTRQKQKPNTNPLLDELDAMDKVLNE